MKRLFGRWAALSVGAVLTLALLEVVFRCTEISLPSYVYDSPRYGRTHRPLAPIHDSQGEGLCLSQVNASGYIGPEVPVENPAGLFRIGLIGDSWVEGLQVFSRHHFRTLLEQRVREASGCAVEVLNFGIGGLDFRDMFFIYKARLEAYSPNVVFFFVSGHDFTHENHIAGPKVRDAGDGRLTFDYGFRESADFRSRMTFRILRDFAMGTVLKEAYEYYQMGRGREILLGRFAAYWPVSAAPAGTEGRPGREEDPHRGVNLSIVEQLGKESAETGREIVLVLVDDEVPDAYKQILSARFRVMDMAEEMRRGGIDPQEMTYWKNGNVHGHWNHRGHRVVAEVLNRAVALRAAVLCGKSSESRFRHRGGVASAGGAGRPAAGASTSRDAG